MERSYLTRVLLFAMALGFSAGCSKFNPCPPQTIDGEATVHTEQIDGLVKVTRGSTTENASIGPNSTGSLSSNTECPGSLFGFAKDDGSGDATLLVNDCLVGGAWFNMSATIPDVRSLASNSVRNIDVSIDLKLNDNSWCAAPSMKQATLTIEDATGGKAPSPSFITQGYRRRLHVKFDSDTIKSEESESSRCDAPVPHIAVDTWINLTAESYSPALTIGGCDLGKTF